MCIMVYVSVAVEGDKPLQTYLEIASVIDGAGFYSLQFYEHLPFKPAWGLCFAVMSYLRNVKLGPVTVPAKLYTPLSNARFLTLLHENGPGTLIGVSRAAYMGGEKATIHEVLNTVNQIVEEIRKIRWSKGFEPEIYVGTSGPKLASAAAAIPEVKGIVVDNLANPSYVRYLREILDAAGRSDMHLIARPFSFLVREGEEAEKPLLEQLRTYLPDLVDGSPMVEAAGLKTEDLRTSDREKEQKLLENFAVFGTAEQVLEKAIALIRAGATHLCFGHPLGPDPVKSVRLLADHVVPYIVNGKTV